MGVKVADYIFARLAEAGPAPRVPGDRRRRHVPQRRARPRDALSTGRATTTSRPARWRLKAMRACPGRPACSASRPGPGGINALNGVFGAWTDSIPMLVVSGQVKRETFKGTYPDLGLRQLGDQEADIVAHGAPDHQVSRAVCRPVGRPLRSWSRRCGSRRTAARGRSGSTCPSTCSRAEVDPAASAASTPPIAGRRRAEADWRHRSPRSLDRLAGRKRPVLIAGTGVRLQVRTTTSSAWPSGSALP